MILDIIIASKDRFQLCKRAINSINHQLINKIIVVDDGSESACEYSELEKLYENVVVLRQNNAGPGVARNLGLDFSNAEFAIILDDDDEIDSKELSIVRNKLEDLQWHKFPVIHVNTSNSKVSKKEYICTSVDIIDPNIRAGDYAPIINLKFKHEVCYPNTKVGMEGLLWIILAERYGIPTWPNKLIHVNNDADNRLTSATGLLSRVGEYFDAQCLAVNTIRESELQHKLKHYYVKKKRSSFIYFVLTENKTENRKLTMRNVSLPYYILSFFIPTALMKSIFKRYRIGVK
jgi:glycosyltransferase involved in cell wall biosynthesis